MDELAEAVHYAYRSPGHVALLNELKREHAERVFSYSESKGCVLNLDKLISSQPKPHIYVCATKPRIDVVTSTVSVMATFTRDNLLQQFLKRVGLLLLYLLSVIRK